MALRAGFAEVDITPKAGTEKVGWLRKIVSEKVLDPLFCHLLVLETGGSRVGFMSLDILSVTSSQVGRIRAAAARAGIPGANLMVAATHNHAGPAVCTVGPSKRDEAYVEFMMAQCEKALHDAVGNLAPAELGVASRIEGRVAFIRRYVMKDGRVRTHPPSCSPEIRCAEGVIDPEIGALYVKSAEGTFAGCVVNFACHPAHHGGDACVSAGWPGQLALRLKESFGCHFVTVFLNGAFGNVHHANPLDPNHPDSMEEIGRILAGDVVECAEGVAFTDFVELTTSSNVVELPYRDLEGPHGVKWPLGQQFGAEGAYEADRGLLRDEIAACGQVSAEVQCVRIGNLAAFVSLPGEVFSQIGLRIKMESPLRNTYVVAAANGMVGYVPHKEAFARGGYETTVASWSKVAPGAGEMLADAALGLLGQVR